MAYTRPETWGGRIKIRDAILAFLYEPTALQRARRLEALATKNALLGGFSHKSFVYKGEVYNADTTPPPKLRIRLLPEFWPVMAEWLQDEKERVDIEEPLVNNGLARILTACKDARDLMKILPESMNHPVRMHLNALVSDTRLSSDTIEAIRAENAHSIQKMMERMVLNLIL